MRHLSVYLLVTLVALLSLTHANASVRRRVKKTSSSSSFSGNTGNSKNNKNKDGTKKSRKSPEGSPSKRSANKLKKSTTEKASYHDQMSKSSKKISKNMTDAEDSTDIDMLFEDYSMDEIVVENEEEEATATKSSKKKKKTKGKTMGSSSTSSSQDMAPTPVPAPSAISGDEVAPDQIPSSEDEMDIEEAPSEDIGTEETEEPATAPTLAPTEATPAETTQQPTSETPVETTEPTGAPITETTAPTVAPTMMETEEPTSAPTVIETEEPTSAPTMIETEEPTAAPTLLTTEAPTTALPETATPTAPEDTAQGDNDQCTGAIALNLGETITGSTVGATMDDMMEEDCGNALGGADQSAPGVWYVVEGTGETMQVYTNATYDMQISVYEGADCDSLSCVSGTGGFPPSYFVGFVAFPSVAGQTYYILINGFTGAVGNFQLYAENYEPLANDVCSGSTEIAIGESISGSTLFAELDEVNQYCSGWDVSQKGVWFALTGNGQKLQAAITGNDFAIQMNIYSGSCTDLTCVSGRIASPSLVLAPIVWDSEENEVYYLLVSGINQEVGSFNLLVNTTMPSQNNNCQDAIEIAVPGTQEGTTVGASLVEDVEHCGLVSDAGAPGVFYAVVGTGDTLLATLYAEYDSQIQIYSGESCESLTCVTGNDQAPWSEGSSEVVWDSVEGGRYFVLVYGYNGEVGPFRLEITPTERPSNDLCSEAIALEVGDVLAGSTALATEDGIDTCGGAIGENLSAPGLFYSVEGTGSTLIADLFSTYDMQLSVFSGTCDALVCVGGTGGDEPDYTSGSVAWDSLEGETYLILVYGYSQRVGEFELSFSETIRPENNVCSGAISIGSNDLLNRTTVLATIEDIDTCGSTGGGNLSAPGVWYALEGTGGAINVDLQSTVKTVQLSIFSGDCNSLDCVAGRLGEGTFINKATETFDSTDGTLYYLYAQVEAGDFSLTTTEVTRPDNDDCISATELSLGSAVSGSTLYASSDNVRDLCGRTNPISAPGTWFSLQGTGDTMTATFEASYDAQLTVFAGIDCETLTCIDGTDGEPPDYQAGSVRWASASGVTYFLFMHGFNDQVGPFNLTVSGADDDAALPESVEADVCTDAIRIEPDGEVVRGSTAFAAPDEGLDYCGSISSEASTGGLWYVFSGTGTVLQVSVGASFDSQISLFAGECDSLTCIDGNNESQVSTASSLILFESSVDQTYYVLVHGVAPSRGEFALSVSEVTIPENDSCEESAILEVGDLVTGSTFAATSADDFAFAQCGTTLGGDSSAPGIFYSVVGTGQLLSVAISANYDMQLTIFEGDDCTNLVCVDGTEGDTANLSAGSITFDSQDGVRYILFVHGFEGRVGEYELSIDSVNRPPNDLCTGAIAIPADLPIGGSTTFSSSDDIADCVTNEASTLANPGVWYQYTSTSPDDVSVTLTNATYTPQVSIFSGNTCEELACVAGEIPEVAQEITWSPEREGDLFFILINGFDGSKGEFEFIISQP